MAAFDPKQTLEELVTGQISERSHYNEILERREGAEMSLERHFRNGGGFSAGFVLMLAFASVGVCQTESAPKGEPESSETVQEIIVYGDKPMHTLRQEFVMAKENLFAVFNSLISNTEYEIDCGYEIRLGSHKRHHVCMPKFARELEAAAASALMDGAKGPGGAPDPAWTREQKKEELLWEEMEAMVREHPEMREALIKLAKTKQAFDGERQRRCEGRIFFCR